MRRMITLVAGLALVTAACAGTEEVEPLADTVPTLIVASPQPGDQLDAPFELHFEVTGFPLGPPPDGHLHIIWGDPETDVVMVFPDAPVGVVEVDGVPEGSHDLVIALANADHSLVDNPEAAVVLPGVQVVAAPEPEPEPAQEPDPAPQQAPPPTPQPAPQQPAPQPDPQPTPAPTPPPTQEPDYQSPY